MTQIFQKIARASLAQGAIALVGKVANLVLAIVLARLLLPEDYGLFTITLVITGLANMLGNFGFQSYLIQARELSEEDVNTCYTLSLVFSVLVATAVALVGALWPDPPPLLREMLFIYAGLMVITGLTYVPLALFKRELDFATSARAEVAYTIVSMSGRVLFAFLGFGSLCFAVGDLLGGFARYAMVHWSSKAHPRLTLPRAEASRPVLWFGLHATSVGLGSFVANQTDKVLLSGTQTLSSVGLYGFASNTAAMFYNALIVPQTSVFLAAFARLKDDLPSAREFLASSTRLIFSMALPISVMWLLEARGLVVGVFGAQWQEAAVLVQVFALDYLVRSMFAGVAAIQMSFGLASRAARTKWTNAAIFVVVLCSAAALGAGLIEYAIAYVCASLIATVHIVHVNATLLQVEWGRYWRNLLPPALIAFASTGVWYVAGTFFPDPILLSEVAIRILCWSAAYVVLSWFFNRPVVKQMLAPIRRMRTPR